MSEPMDYRFQTFDDPADPTFNNLMGINNRGLIAGFYGSGDAGHPNQGYLLTQSRDFVAMDFPASPENPALQTQLTGLNDRGVSVGYFYNTNNGVPLDDQFGFYVKEGVYTEVNNPKTPGLFGNPGPQSGVLVQNQLMGVNDRDVAVGFYSDASGNSHGYTYDIKSGKFSADINDPSGVSTVTSAINDRGSLAGFFTDAAGNVHGFLDRHGKFTTVDAPGASETQLLGLNDRGLAVGFDVVNGVTHGLVYDSRTGSFTTLDDPHAAGSTILNGLDDKGDIVGFYTDAAGNTHGLLATPLQGVHRPGEHGGDFAFT